MPAKDGTLVVARNMGGGKPPPAVSWLPAGFAWAATVRTRILTGAQGAEMFPHLVYSHSGDRFAAVDARVLDEAQAWRWNLEVGSCSDCGIVRTPG